MAGDDTWTPAFHYYLWVILLATGSGQLISRPKLNPDTNSMNIPAGSTLTLNCVGQYGLQWSTPFDKKQPNRKQEENSRDNENFISNLTVENIVFSDTGYYTCSYLGTKQNSYENSTQIYVFVSDEDNLFIKPELNILTFQPGIEARIPCRPTIPTLSVSLKKGTVEMDLKSGDIIFDNRKGFIALYPNIFYSGQFTCIGNFRNRTASLSFHIIWFDSPTYIPLPYIDNSNAHFATQGGTFSLTCIALVSSEIMSLNWDYKQKDTKESYRFTEEKFSRQQGSVHGSTSKTPPLYELKTVLKVTDVQETDEGYYYCSISDSQRSKKVETFIHIHDRNAIEVKFKTDLDRDKPNEIPKSRGMMNLVVQIRAHPKPTRISWWKNGIQEITNKSGKYEVEISSNITTLKIKNLHSNDTANYTLSVQIDTYERNLSLILWITSEPLLTLIDHRPFVYVTHESHFSLTCKSNALPLANISWDWKACDVNTCANNYEHLSYNEEKYDMQKLGVNWIVSTLELKAKHSGYYRCSSHNSLGTSHVETLIITTDEENSDTEFGFSVGKQTSPTLFERENFVVLCSASKYNYTSSLQWKWSSIKSPKTYELIKNDSVAGRYVVKSDTPLSHRLELRIPYLQAQDAGYYTCETTALASHSAISQRVHLHVIKTEPPTLIYTNMDGNEQVFDKEEPVEFICNVSGTPAPKIKWVRDNETLDSSQSAQYVFTNNDMHLIISRVVDEDEGIYFCFAENRVGLLMLNATLKVRETPLPPVMSSAEKAAIIVSILIVLVALLILSVIVARKCYIDRKERMEIYQLEKALFERGEMERYNPDLPFEEQIEFLPYDQRWEFPREKLKLGKTIGQGAFGRVVRAEAYGIIEGEERTTVAVKMLKENANVEQRKALMQELKIMIHLGRHVNILNLLGACVQNPRKGELLAIMEFCRYGNLRNFLLRHRQSFVNQMNPETGEIDKTIAYHRLSAPPLSPRTFSASSSTGADGYLIPNSPGLNPNSPAMTSSGATNHPQEFFQSGNSADSSGAGEDSSGFGRLSISAKSSGAAVPLSTSDLVCYGFQIAAGMEYLASRKLVHRDLAARNILLADDHIIKICDFGLAKDCYKKAYYRKKGDGPLPVKWMAIESIKDKVFSVESDVWSYGIVLWELFSLGSNPYPGFEVDEHFYKKLLSGYRMEKPEYVTDDIYNIMVDCWDKEPHNRPKFSELKDRIGSYLDKAMRQHYDDLNDNYLRLHQLTTMNHDYVNLRDGPDGPEAQYVTPKPTSDSHRDSENGYINSSAMEDDADSGYLQMRGSNTSIRPYKSTDGESSEFDSMLPQTSTEPKENVVARAKLTNPYASGPKSTNGNTPNNNNGDSRRDASGKNLSLPPTYSTVMEGESVA